MVDYSGICFNALGKFSSNLGEHELSLSNGQFLSLEHNLFGVYHISDASNRPDDDSLMGFYSLDTGACVFNGEFPIDDIISCIRNTPTDIICLQDVEYSDLLITSLKLFGYSFAFIPTFTYGNKYSGMLTISKNKPIDSFFIYIDSLSRHVNKVNG